MVVVTRGILGSSSNFGSVEPHGCGFCVKALQLRLLTVQQRSPPLRIFFAESRSLFFHLREKKDNPVINTQKITLIKYKGLGGLGETSKPKSLRNYLLALSKSADWSGTLISFQIKKLIVCRGKLQFKLHTITHTNLSCFCRVKVHITT